MSNYLLLILVSYVLRFCCCQNPCVTSVTTVNGGTRCQGEVIFQDSFDSKIDPRKWQHSIRISGEGDEDFVVMDKLNENSFVENGKLVIKPTILPEDTVLTGNMVLSGCDTRSVCQKKAMASNIIPPVRSAVVKTEHAFSFKYGTITIRAKLPRGDWLFPVLHLNPKNMAYGRQYNSGVIRIASAKGNRQLTCNHKEMGNRLLDAGVIMGPQTDIRARSVRRLSDSLWSSDFHNYTLIWSPDNISFLVDGLQKEEIRPLRDPILWEVLGIPMDKIPDSWKVGPKRTTNIVPFDQEFYISIGVSVGGVREFPNECTSNNQMKPWRNNGAKSIWNFWNDRHIWKMTWGTHSILEVDSVTVTALSGS